VLARLWPEEGLAGGGEHSKMVSFWPFGSVQRPSEARDGRPQQSPGRAEAGADLPSSASSSLTILREI
jgi:hypothetical protein